MPMLPLIVLLLSAMLAGLVLGVLHLKQIRKPVLIGLHMLLGFGALAVLVFVLKGVPAGDGLATSDLGSFSAGFLALAGFVGLLAPIVSRGSRLMSNAMLFAHVGAGVVGVMFCMAWLSIP